MQLVQPTSYTPTSATGATAGTVFLANTARVYFQIQNVGTNPIYLKFGTGASSTDYSEILKGGTAGLDGTGGIYKSSTVVYTGVVSVGGTAPTYVAYELTP